MIDAAGVDLLNPAEGGVGVVEQRRGDERRSEGHVEAIVWIMGNP
jgi:hypothetical protein